MDYESPLGNPLHRPYLHYESTLSNLQITLSYPLT